MAVPRGNPGQSFRERTIITSTTSASPSSTRMCAGRPVTAKPSLNGFLRENSYKDAAALFDWIKTRPDLDSDRVMVMGGSYGGHMTLAISAFYADRIRCAIDIVGIGNLVTFLENTSAYRRDLRRVEYGDERDPKMREFLNRIAPLNNADKITKPLFVVQGGNDPRVPLSESVQMVETVRKHGTPVSYLMAKDEGHAR